LVRERYRAEQKSQQLQELMALHDASPQASPASQKTGAGSPPAAPAVGKTKAAASARDVPPGYVPREPGSPMPPATVSIPDEPRAEAGVVTAVAPGPGTPDMTLSVVATLPKPAKMTPPAAPPPADAVDIAGALRAGPMASRDQVQVLELVTQIAAMVRDLQAQDAQLRAAIVTAKTDTVARLDDFERRLALLEARNALAAAGTAPAPKRRIGNRREP
jgi:hypothetical protein